MILAFIITLGIYYSQGMPKIDGEVLEALVEIGKFWFAISWSITLLFSLFRGMKHIFNRCHNGYVLKLMSCPKGNKSQVIEVVGYGDLVKVWRKWLMLMIWLVGSEMILLLFLNYIFSMNKIIFSWFNIYVLYTLLLFAGYFSLMILSVRCKQVRLSRC